MAGWRVRYADRHDPVSPRDAASLQQPHESPGSYPVYRLYKASDDWLFIACGNTTFWNKFCLAVEKPEWVGDPRYEKAPWGIAPEDRDELADNIAAIISAKSREEWLRILRENDVPCAP